MEKYNFRLPERILQLEACGIWPTEKSGMNAQDVEPITKEKLVKKIAPDENYICFASIKNFYLLSEEFEHNQVMKEFGAVNEIDPKSCLIIGDFGIGSDSYIVLDYSDNKLAPSVKRLAWNKGGNTWEKLASNVDEFFDILDVRQ